VCEDADLLLPGESPSDNGSELPVRLLSEFYIHDIDSGQLVNVAELMLVDSEDASTQRYSALGFAKAWRDPYNNDDGDEDEADEDEEYSLSHNNKSEDDRGEHIRLSPILEFSIHNMEERDNDEFMDG